MFLNPFKKSKRKSKSCLDLTSASTSQQGSPTIPSPLSPPATMVRTRTTDFDATLPDIPEQEDEPGTIQAGAKLVTPEGDYARLHRSNSAFYGHLHRVMDRVSRHIKDNHDWPEGSADYRLLLRFKKDISANLDKYEGSSNKLLVDPIALQDPDKIKHYTRTFEERKEAALGLIEILSLLEEDYLSEVGGPPQDALSRALLEASKGQKIVLESITKSQEFQNQLLIENSNRNIKELAIEITGSLEANTKAAAKQSLKLPTVAPPTLVEPYADNLGYYEMKFRKMVISKTQKK